MSLLNLMSSLASRISCLFGIYFLHIYLHVLPERKKSLVGKYGTGLNKSVAVIFFFFYRHLVTIWENTDVGKRNKILNFVFMCNILCLFLMLMKLENRLPGEGVSRVQISIPKASHCTTAAPL